MQLSTNSWHTKLFRYLYGDCLPNSLCPYFWATVLGLITFIPMTLLYLPVFIFRHPKKFNGLFSSQFATAFVVILFGSEIVFIIVALIQKYGLLKALLIILGFIIGLIVAVGIVVGVGYVIEYFSDKMPSKKSSGRPNRQRKPNIFLAFVRATYKRYCPIIHWVSDEVFCDEWNDGVDNTIGGWTSRRTFNTGDRDKIG